MSHHCRLTGNGCVLNFDVPDSTKPVVREKLQDPTEIRAVEHCSEAQSGGKHARLQITAASIKTLGTVESRRCQSPDSNLHTAPP
ncbi:hypothetical protein WJX79_001471 [Trebouxia sp. C0005]